jgi:hypothetical protein
MVYCGKPSRACEQCKQRKTKVRKSLVKRLQTPWILIALKCSLKSNCRPCIKAGLICPGPRDPDELVFRDESLVTIQKEITRRRPKNLEISIDDRARGSFISHYVVGNSRAFDYIPPLLARVNIENHLAASLMAVSLAHYFSQTHFPDILHRARQSYINALRLINEALQSSKLATQDATMLAVLLLDLFEKITRTAPRSLESWTKHINGALTLAKLRGTGQFRGTVGIRMFVQLSSTILISCVQRDVEAPPELLELRGVAGQYFDTHDPKWKYSTLVIRFIGFRVAIRNGRLSLSEVIALAKTIDEEFQAILDNMPPVWKYDTISSSGLTDSDDIFEDYFHVFPDHRITHIWNNIRLSRILLHETIREHLQKDRSASPSNSHLEIQRSKNIIASLSTDICASVPQYTRVRCINKNNPTLLNGVHPVLSFETAKCYSLIFALYIAARSTASPEKLRRWVIERLRFLSSAMGIVEAHKTAEVLEGSPGVNPWAVYAMLGSYSFSA